jgi:hypothetical protein
MNGDKEIVIVKLIIQRKKKETGTTTRKRSVCLAKVLDLFFLHPVLVLVLGILSFVGKGAGSLPSCQTACKGGLLEVFFFFLLSLVLWAVSL